MATDAGYFTPPDPSQDPGLQTTPIERDEMQPVKPVQLPPQLDYRDAPNVGQDASARHGENPRDDPYCEGHPVAPQPDIGPRGYTLNSLDTPPNHMVPGGANEHLPDGHTPENPHSMMAWDFIGAGGD